MIRRDTKITAYYSRVDGFADVAEAMRISAEIARDYCENVRMSLMLAGVVAPGPVPVPSSCHQEMFSFRVALNKFNIRMRHRAAESTFIVYQQLHGVAMRLARAQMYQEIALSSLQRRLPNELIARIANQAMQPRAVAHRFSDDFGRNPYGPDRVI